MTHQRSPILRYYLYTEDQHASVSVKFPQEMKEYTRI